MKKKLVVAATALSLLVPSLSHSVSAQTNESNASLYEQIQSANLTAEEKNQLTKDGKVIQAIDPQEIKKALNKRIEMTSGEEAKEIVFDDGSAIVISIGEAPVSVATDSNSSAALQPAKYVGNVRGATEYKIVSWTGVTLMTYTMYQDAVTNGEKLTSWEPSPTSSIDPTPLLNLWELVSEIPSVRPSGTGCVATMNPKFKFGVSDFINIKSLSLKGTLVMYGDGTYKGFWEVLG